ncbi:MAG: HAMP domain-containing sensor histidine kinase [Acidobacteriota bacterium]|nr:HAMP domain-containing sensor histidine kinase [Acidobacteriota bacterium]
MKRLDSLRFRILASFTISGAILGIVFGGLVYGTLHGLEDQLSVNTLRLESQTFLDAYRNNPAQAPPRTRLLKGYIGAQQLPVEFASVAAYDPGVYEFTDENMVLVADLPKSQGKFFLIIDNRDVDPLESMHLDKIIIAGVLLVTLLSGWLGNLLGNRMLAPLLSLAREVRGLEPSNLPYRLKGRYYDDEVGQVAQGLEVSLGRVSELIDREQRITRDASHELRSPVTVIKGAAELVSRLSSIGKPVERPLRRIHRAVKDMENIIETFLYLGREGHSREEAQTFDLEELVQDLVAQNRYLIEEKEVTVSVEAESGQTLKAPRTVTAIAVGNLIRNAFQYTDRGSVTVRVNSHGIEVADTGRGMDEATRQRVTERDARGGKGKGFGLGLSIVADFCKRFNWTFGLESGTGEGTRAYLNFPNER